MFNTNVMSERYAGKEINRIFSEEGKNGAERELWIAVMEGQKRLGIDIPTEDIEKFKAVKDNIDLDLIKQIERKTRHDVKAKIEAFVQTADAGQYLHRGMTSRDLTDNVEQMQIKKAGTIIFGKYVSVLRHFIMKTIEYCNIVITARSHHQPAQISTLGRRFSMWAEELMFHLESFEFFLENYPLRGIKGPVGTQLDMLTLLGSHEKVDSLERIVAKQLGFSRTLHSPGQVYPRSLDYALLSHLAQLACACQDFAVTMRLMSGAELVTEGFKEGQVGSSAMPHKMNTRSSERICSFANLLKMYADGGSRIAGDQWEEGDVSCSALRRVVIADAFYASDGLCETILTVLNEMGAYPFIIKEEVDRYMPFLATTEILSFAVKKGIGREVAHGLIKKHAVAIALEMRESGAGKHDLALRLANEPVFREKEISHSELVAILLSKEKLIGNAERQIIKVESQASELFKRYPNEAKYEPGEIL